MMRYLPSYSSKHHYHYCYHYHYHCYSRLSPLLLFNFLKDQGEIQKERQETKKKTHQVPLFNFSPVHFSLKLLITVNLNVKAVVVKAIVNQRRKRGKRNTSIRNTRKTKRIKTRRRKRSERKRKRKKMQRYFLFMDYSISHLCNRKKVHVILGVLTEF